MENLYLFIRHLTTRLAIETVILLKKNESMTVTEMYVKNRTEEPIQSQILAPMRKFELVNAERNGKFIHYSLNREKWEAVILFCQKFSGEKNAKAAIKRTSDIMAARWKKNKHRDKVYKFILNNHGTTVKPIYTSLGIGQSICSRNIGVLEKAGFVEEKKDGKKRQKFVTKLEEQMRAEANRIKLA